MRRLILRCTEIEGVTSRNFRESSFPSLYSAGVDCLIFTVGLEGSALIFEDFGMHLG